MPGQVEMIGILELHLAVRLTDILSVTACNGIQRGDGIHGGIAAERREVIAYIDILLYAFY